MLDCAARNYQRFYMVVQTSVSEKGGGLDEDRMEDILDCVRRGTGNRFRLLCGGAGYGSYVGFTS